MRLSHMTPRSPRRPTAGLAVALLALAPMAAACGDGASGSTSEDVIKVGVLQSVTGDLATFGIPERDVSRLVIDEVNKNGGIDGRKVEMVFYDPVGDTTKAVDQTRRLIQQDQVDVVVGGGTSSGVALAMKPLLQQAGVFFMSTEAAEDIVSPAEDSPTTFATTISTSIVAKKMLDSLAAEGVERVGVLADNSGYGQAGVASFEQVAGDSGVEIVSESYDPVSTDLKPQISRLRSQKVDAYVNWTATPSAIVFLKNAKELGIDATQQPVMLSFTFSNPALMSQAKDAGVGVQVGGIKAPLLETIPAGDAEGDLLRELDEKLRDRFNYGVTIYAAQTYDAMKATLEAIDKANSTKAEDIASALTSLDYQGMQGKYAWSDEDHRGLSTDNVTMMTWDGSKFVTEGNGS